MLRIKREEEDSKTAKRGRKEKQRNKQCEKEVIGREEKELL